MAYRKDPEVALVAREEALAVYADAVDNAARRRYTEEWPDTFDKSLAQQLPPHQHVSYFILDFYLFAAILPNACPFFFRCCIRYYAMN